MSELRIVDVWLPACIYVCMHQLLNYSNNLLFVKVYLLYNLLLIISVI